MAHRIRMSLVDEARPITAAVADDGDVAAEPGRFHVLLIVEETDTGDYRRFVEGSVTWRDLPLPLMGIDKTTWEHQDAVLIGNIETIERRGTELHGWGSYLSAPEGDAARLIGLCQRGELRGVSVDIDAVEFEILVPVLPEDDRADVDDDDDAEVAMADPQELPREDVDGNPHVVITMDQPIMRVTEGRIMGATVVPFPAFQEAFIEADEGMALAASAAVLFADHRLTGAMVPLTAAAALAPGREAGPARFAFPDIPPAGWFEVPEAPGPMPLTILDSGQVFGHLAVWGECHIGMAGECVEAPTSPSGYARFHVGETPVDDGGRVSTGRLTFHCGHADTRLGADATRAHYDHSGMVAADLVAVDGEYGVWVCGAARSTLSVAEVREVMACPPSGDWRRFGRDLDLVAALCVNVPGFNTPRARVASGAPADPARFARVRTDEGLVASLILSSPAVPAGDGAGMDTELARRVIARIAATIGRRPEDRIAAIAARVHGGRS
jgi:hypothetical protein